MSLKNNGCGCVMRTILIILGVYASMMILANLDKGLTVYVILFLILFSIPLPVILPFLLITWLSKRGERATSDENEEDNKHITYNQCIIQQNYYLQNASLEWAEITEADQETWE